jgi:hypothetical protein
VVTETISRQVAFPRLATQTRREIGTSKVEARCDFNCGKTGEPLIYFKNTDNGHEWYCHLSCLEEQLYLHQEMRRDGD